MTIQGLLAEKRYRSAKDSLSQSSAEALKGFWPKLVPMERLTAFHLLEEDQALALFDRLDFDDQYFLFCGFPREALAPLLESMGAEDKNLFAPPSASLYKKLLERLNRSFPARPAAVGKGAA